ncbi:hypothetical protein HK405_003056 [Cladochytrium tenue]|nr:hypothetical protein HK405_003056 [Cladochytrium tenue]
MAYLNFLLLPQFIPCSFAPAPTRPTPTSRRLVELTRAAFHNHFQPGADEHYLLHMLQTHADHIPELYLAAFASDGGGGAHPVGCIAFTRSCVVHADGTSTATCTFGPLATHPAHRRRGVARALVEAALERAAALGEFAACIIYGDPRFYGRLGFRAAERFDVTDAQGYFHAALLAVELGGSGALGGGGKFEESAVFNEVSVEQADAWDVARGAQTWEKVAGTESQREHQLMVTMRYKKTTR